MSIRRIAIAALLVLSTVLHSASCHAAGRVIAAVMSSDQPRYREAHRSFVKSLAALGHTASNTEIILQSPNPDPISWSNTIRKFNAYNPDLIVAYGAPAALTAMKESERIPVMSVDVFTSENPERGGCGVSSRVPMVTLLKTLKSIRPYHRIGVIYNSREAGSQRQLAEVKKYAAQLDMSVDGWNVASASAVDSAITAMLGKVDVIVATESGIVNRQFDRMIARARVRNIPVVTTMPDGAEKGALASLEINPQEQGHMAAEIADRILNGTKTEHLPLLSPKRVDLVINLRAAREMGIAIPFQVLSNATRVLK